MESLNTLPVAPAMLTLKQLQAPAIQPVPPWMSVCNPRPGVRVGLVCSDGELPRMVRRELCANPGIQITAQASTLRESLCLQEVAGVDVLLVELQLQDGSGLDLVAHLKGRRSSAEVIVMAWFDDDEAVLRAFDAGAAGWLVLGNWCGNLALAVLNVANGGAALSRALARRLLRRPVRPSAVPVAPHPPLMALTEREREVLAQLVRGLRNKEIARTLTISDETVNAHLKSIYRKMHVHSRTQVVSIASRAGML